MFIAGLGAFFFGLTIGWIAYRTLRLRSSVASLSDFFAILGVIGGAAVIALFKSDVLFGLYSLGLVIGFFAYFAVGLILNGKQEVQPWQLAQIPPTPTSDAPSDANPTDVGNVRASAQIPPTPTSDAPSNVNPTDVGNVRSSSRRSKTSNTKPADAGNAS